MTIWVFAFWAGLRGARIGSLEAGRDFIGQRALPFQGLRIVISI